MPNITDFMSNVFDLLTQTFGAALTPGTFLQIGWPGISLSPADFKSFDSPGGNYDPNRAEETFSLVSNIAPTCNALRFDNSGFEIDDLYQILIAGAIPQGADLTNLTANSAYKLFSDAQYGFINAQKGTTHNPNLFYYPCRAAPIDWYTEVAAQSWTTLSLTSAQVKPAKADAPFIRLGGKQLVDKGVWKIAPIGTDSALIKSRLQTNVSNRITQVTAIKPVALSAGVRRPLEVTGIKAKTSVLTTTPAKLAAGPARGALFDDKKFVKTFTELNATAATKKNLRPTYLLQGLGNLNQLSFDPQKYNVVPAKNLVINHQLLITSLLNNQLVSAPVEATTEGFEISFRFCVVNITRSWLNAALLNVKNWYLAGSKAGDYSTGTIENNPGMFPLLPTAFIAIRDLKITAKWDQQDLSNAAQAKSFGPFDLRSGSFSNNALEAKGLQIIAWLSRLNPMLPPLPDPSQG